MGLLERAKSLKSSSTADASAAEGNESVLENIVSDSDTGIFENFNAEDFDAAEMIRLDSDDSIFNEKTYSAPVKSDDFIIDDINTESDDSHEKDFSSKDSEKDEPVVSFDGELEDFLSNDEEPSIENNKAYIPESVDDSVESLPDESISFDEDIEPLDNVQLSSDEQSISDSSDPFTDPEAVLDEKDLLADIDSVVQNNPKPEPLITPTGPPVSDDFFGVLNEASRELLRSNNSEDFFNVLLLLVMGQFTASSAAILVPVNIDEPEGKWTLRDVRGIRLKSRSVTFRGMDPLMGQILESRNILDIEEFAGLEGFREECSIFYSIGARYILPIRAKGVTRVILALGDKISGKYEPAEIENMRVYAATVSPIFERLMDIEKITEENRQYVERNTEYSDIDKIERDLRRSSGGADIESIIEEKMNHYGAESFCFFVRNERGDSLVPRFCEKADLMGLKASGFSIPADSELCSYFIQKDEWEDFENPASFNPLRSAFTDTHIIKMNLCAAYPFLMRGYIAGLLIVMRGKRERIADTKMHIMRLSRHVFAFLQGNAAISVYENPFSDIIGKPMLRMEKTLSMADDLGISVSFILFHVKNLKRYRSIYGTADSENLMLKIREIIESRISHSDYGLRTEIGKVIVVLPGKTKKYAVPFATAVRNEVSAAFRERESQIMLTYLIAEYPADGKTLHDILDYLS